MRISDWSSDVCSSDLIRLWTIWRRPCGKNTPGLRPRDFDRVWRFAAGGRPVFPAASAPPAIALAQQVGHRLGRHRLADQVALQLAAADAAQEVALGGGDRKSVG